MSNLFKKYFFKIALEKLFQRKLNETIFDSCQCQTVKFLFIFSLLDAPKARKTRCQGKFGYVNRICSKYLESSLGQVTNEPV